MTAVESLVVGEIEMKSCLKSSFFSIESLNFMQSRKSGKKKIKFELGIFDLRF